MNREEFQAYAKKKIDDIYDTIEELEKKRDKASDAAKARINEQLDSLKERKADLSNRFDHLKNASGESWEEVKAAFSESADSFKAHLTNIKTHFSGAS